MRVWPAPMPHAPPEPHAGHDHARHSTTCRLMPTFVRIGTFQLLAERGQKGLIEAATSPPWPHIRWGYHHGPPMDHEHSILLSCRRGTSLHGRSACTTHLSCHCHPYGPRRHGRSACTTATPASANVQELLQYLVSHFYPHLATEEGAARRCHVQCHVRCHIRCHVRCRGALV